MNACIQKIIKIVCKPLNRLIIRLSAKIFTTESTTPYDSQRKKKCYVQNLIQIC